MLRARLLASMLAMIGLAALADQLSIQDTSRSTVFWDGLMTLVFAVPIGWGHATGFRQFALRGLAVLGGAVLGILVVMRWSDALTLDLDAGVLSFLGGLVAAPALIAVRLIPRAVPTLAVAWAGRRWMDHWHDAGPEAAEHSLFARPVQQEK